MEIELDNGLVVKINEDDKTATVIKLNKQTEDVFIPRYAEYKGNKYKIISLAFYALSCKIIRSLTFPEDSEVNYFDGSIFNSSRIKKLQIPARNFLLGKSENDSDEFDVLYYARYDIENAVIPKQVKIVKNSSFYNHKNLKSIIFTEDSKLKIIESHSFTDSSIQKLVLPSSVEEIHGNNFYRVKDLVEVEISTKNKNFSVFDKKYILTKSKKTSQTFDVILFAVRDIQIANIPLQIREISKDAFHYCNQLKTITFEPNSSLEKTGKYSISYNPLLTKIVFPKSLKIIGENTLSDNKNIESIIALGTSIKLESFCFCSCYELTSISFPNATEIEFGNYSMSCSDKAKLYILRNANISGSGIKDIENRIEYIDEEHHEKEVSKEEIKTDSSEEESEEEMRTTEKEAKSSKEKITIDKEDKENKYNDADFLMKHIRYLEDQLREFKPVKTFNPEYDQQSTKTTNKKGTEECFFIGPEEESYKYEMCEKIGEGDTSIVYKVIEKSTLKPFCKKVLKCEDATLKDLKNAIKEFEVLHSLDHPCICHAISLNTQEELEDGNTTVAIFIDFIEFKLSDCLKSNFITNTLKTRIVVELSHGMRYLHSKKLIYRDLNINNIMLNSIFQTKLIDFGLVRINEMLIGEEAMSSYSMTKNVGMDVFMSPEMFNGEEYDDKTDVYSFGVVVYFIFVGKLPQQNINDRMKQKPIQLPKESPMISKVCIQLISKCLSNEPKERPTFNEIIEFLRENKFMLSSDVDPSIISKRDNELEMIEN